MDDIYRIGEAVIQVSQPRQPCWKLDRRMGTKKIGPLVIRTGYSGWYFRVLAEGLIQAELPLTLVERPAPEWTIRRCNEAAIRA